MTITIPSCNAYRQCWEPWVAFQKLHWPDCPYETVLLTDGLGDEEPTSPFDCTIGLLLDAGFCGNLLYWCQNHADQECVIVMLDDHWICGRVDENRIAVNCMAAMQFNDVGCFRLHPSPGPTTMFDSGWHGVSDVHTPYRISTAPSIWRVSYLIKLLELLEREKPADEQYGFRWPTAGYFEIVGSILSMTFPETILAASVPIIPFWNSAIVKGRWCRGVVEEAAKLGVVVDTSGRPFRSRA